jgi:hypothetical protein
MARIRTIKPEFWKSESLSDLPEATHMLAAALINYSDDQGYFNANPKLVQSECCPLREPSVSVPESLRSLQAIGYLRLGIGDDGKRYGHLVGFLDHQKISHPTPSKIANKTITWDNSGKSPENIVKAPDDFRPEQGKEQGTGNGKERLADGEFDSFFAVFPKKEQIDNARKEYLAALDRGAKSAELHAGAERFAAHVSREKIPLRFVALAKTWLADGCWKDRYGAEEPEAVLPALDPSWPAAQVQRWSKNIGEVNFRTYFGPAEYIDVDPVILKYRSSQLRRLAEEHFPRVAKEVALEVAA